MVNCTGKEKFCFDVLSRSKADGEVKDIIMKGCTIKSTCVTMNRGIPPILEEKDTTIVNARCTPDPSRGSQSSGLYLPIFSGLLFLKIPCLLLFLLPGASLECEICSSDGIHCTGPKKTCPLGKNTCMTAYTENTVDGKTEHTIEKDCATADICTSSAIELYFGPGRAMRTIVYCCIEGLCKKIESKFPPIETRMNGKQCPACHVWSDTCKEEMVNCTGHNVYCFDVSSHSHAATNSVDRTMKGCTTKSVCSSIRSGRSPILQHSDMIMRATCIPEVSRGSRCSGLLLPTFSGLLLLLKILM
ncbi:phospholipase A2 inhibitor and Ly6/PLAUR domain-containing protein-like [Zootoca vivipara]|uniref:phospholipase A2 inhibitor and Ly6/PLAUR domain-containing protein-like n=1 Tax=Zootoca vivipara TaxID=8524 RepID=UPI00293BC57E|nr:phospholipase A2 inhibitor and Ly6/PLAUR domain-containing protein-like [Zootoca vivipara]